MVLRTRFEIKDWVYKAAAIGVVSCAIYYFIAFIYITVSRIHYPFSLDWVEGESFVQVQRILSGKLLYDQPSYEYVALTYPPLYFYVSAVFARLMGLGFFPLRLVSLMASLGCIAAIYLICRKEGTGVTPAWIASGFFTATYQLDGTWFDIARIDMLAVFLVLLSIYLLRFQTLASYVVAGLAFTLACLTKQTNLLTLVLLCFYFIAFERKKSWGFVIAFLSSFSIASVLLDRIYMGWYKFFIFDSPVGSGETLSITPSMIVESIPEFWLDMILLPTLIVTLFTCAYILINLIRKEVSKTLLFYLFCGAGMIGTSWASIAHRGGYKNDLVPAFAILAIHFGLSIQKLCYEQRLSPLHKSALLGICMIQFAMLYFPISAQIPTRQDLLAGQVLVNEIQTQAGNVYVPFHPELPLLAGKPTFASWNAMYQLEGNYGGGDLEEAQRVKVEFLHAMANHQFSMIILDKDLNWIWGHPERYYSISPEQVFQNQNVFWPVTGWQVRPTMKMFPNQP